MYHQHSQQQQGSQTFPNAARPPHHQPPPNQHQNRPPSDMLTQVMGFQFPRPTQLPDELESALAIRGTRDMDHRLVDHMNRPNQHQNQTSGSGISQHGGYSSNPLSVTSDNQSGHQQGVDWSSYQPPTKLFAGPPSCANQQSQRHQGPQQQSQNSHAGTNVPSWTGPVSDSPLPQAQHTRGAVGGDGQSLYTPESAGSILASFGLSNEDLEVLSHYPDDQLTPDTLPFILRDIQINKSGNQKTVASASTSSSSFSRTVHDMQMPPSRNSPLARSRSPEVPSLLTVTQTAGKVIDYGHASRTKEDSSNRETFKREPLSSERTVKMYPSSSSAASSSAPKEHKPERRKIRLEPTESSKHGDQDYRRTSSAHRKSSRSPGREFPPSPKSRNLDRDYRHEVPKPRPSSETRSEASSRRSLSSSSGSKPHNSSKKLPTPTMISDFSAVSPKVYPHTCSLCHIQCDREKDWIDHINTVNHTAACRDLRNKYPDWKPNPPSRHRQYGSPSHLPSASPPHGKHRMGPHPHRLQGRSYSPHHHPRHQYYPEHGHHGPHRPSSTFREHRPERRDMESSGPPVRIGLKRPHQDSTKFSSKAGHMSKHGPLQSSTKPVKSGTKPGAMAMKMSAKPPPAKKKKKIATAAVKPTPVADRLVYLTGIPKDASEKEVTDLVGSFGKINNVILMPCSEEESEKGEGQKASVCMAKAEYAQALANSTNLSIRDQQLTALLAKKPEAGQTSDANSEPAGQDKGAAEEVSGDKADQKTSDVRAVVLIAELPESGWSESDIIKLVEPFGTPSDVIVAAQLRKVLVSVSDAEIAEEMVKVHSFSPMKINDCELKMTHLKQSIGFNTPVALYNLLMGSANPLKCSVPVGWRSLLVISNVPNTTSGSSEVQKLVQRFGTVIKTLVLNSMVICQLATAAMALSVYKRFKMFPCIIHNNPLHFSRKPDPKANTQSKVITAYLDSPESTPSNGKGSQRPAATDEEETTQIADSESLLEKDGDTKDETMKSADEKLGKEEPLEENGSEDKKANVACDSLAAPDAKPEAGLESDPGEAPAENVMEMTANDETATPPQTSDGIAASQEAGIPPPFKVTQEMVTALLVKCRARTTSNASTNGEQKETDVETDQDAKAAKETSETAKQRTENDVKRLEREHKEREARKERELRERERKEREKRAWEKERARRERERDERARRERERREEERRERERRERKRGYGEGVSGFKPGYKQSYGRDDQYNSKAETETVEEEEEEESDDFPFNLSDFVTVDEVGEVADLIPMETTEKEEDVATSDEKEAAKDTSMECTTETGTSDISNTLEKCDDELSVSEPTTVPTADTANGLASSDVASEVIQTPTASPPHTKPSCPPEEPKTETTLAAPLDSTTEVEPSPTPAPTASAALSDSNSPTAGEVTVQIKQEETEDCAPAPAKIKEEEREVLLVKMEERQETQEVEDKKTEPPAEETGKHRRSEDQTSMEVTVKVENPPLPPFNPSNPVGMEFLVPKTGFFCKPCNRFFSGAKEAEISHCKTLKHYTNLQKYLQTTKTQTVATTPESS